MLCLMNELAHPLHVFFETPAGRDEAHGLHARADQHHSHHRGGKRVRRAGGSERVHQHAEDEVAQPLGGNCSKAAATLQTVTD